MEQAKVALREVLLLEKFDHDGELDNGEHWDGCQPFETFERVRWAIDGKYITDPARIAELEETHRCQA